MQEIVSAEDDKEIIFVEIPEWGGSVGIRVMTGRDGVKLADRTRKAPTEAMFILIATCLVDENGNRLFADDKAAADDLGKKSMRVLTRLQEEIMRLNRLGKYAEEKPAKEGEEPETAAKND